MNQCLIKPISLSRSYIMTVSKHSSFHRLVRPGNIDRGDLVRKITESYFLTYLPDNKPYRPNKRGEIGMYLSGIWYQLVLKPVVMEADNLDSYMLQEKILQPVFGIENPSTDDRVSYYSHKEGWDQLLLAIRRDATVVVFTLFA